MNHTGKLNRILLVMCILMCVFVSSVIAGEVQNPADNSARIPVLNETITTTTAPSLQDLPVHSTPPNKAPVNPAYLRYLQQQQAAKLSSLTSKTADPEKPVSSHATGAIPLYEDMSYLRGTFVVDDSGLSYPAGTNQHAAFPAYYDLRTLGRVSPVKNQGSAGVCWAFATVASLESTLLTGEVWDFSENNMKNLLSNLYPEGFDRNFSTGGATHKESTAYLVRWTGPINQSDDPYNPTSPYSPTNKTVQKHVQRVDFIPDRLSSTDNDNIKTAIQNTGAVYTTYNMSENIPYWNENTKSYYYFGDADLNHAVAIVGWDDRWSKNNFTTTPPGDGAFIIKNSWGSTWGDSGYFYCSYYDKLIGKDNALFTSAPPTNYDNIYQYDPFGWVTSAYTAREKVGWAANVFNSNRSQNLSAVSFYTTDTNTNYELQVYWNPNSGPVMNSSGAAFTQTGTFGNAGYHTVAIPQEIHLDSNDRFAVAIKLTNPSYNWSIAIQDWTLRTTKARAYPGQGYFSNDGVVWSDVTGMDDYKNSSICIKAFTKTTRKMTPGAYRDGVFYLRNSNNEGPADNTFTFGAPSGDRPLAGDWNGDAIDTVGVFRNNTGTFYLRNNNSAGIADTTFAFGAAGDIPLIGDWTGQGKDTVGVFRQGVFYLKDSNSAGIADTTFAFGAAGDIPLVGDWTGQGKDTVGVFRQGVFYLKNSNSAGNADNTFAYGAASDTPIIGDGTGQRKDTVGVIRQGVWYLRNSNSAGNADIVFTYGEVTDSPVDGTWI